MSKSHSEYVWELHKNVVEKARDLVKLADEFPDLSPCGQAFDELIDAIDATGEHIPQNAYILSHREPGPHRDMDPELSALLRANVPCSVDEMVRGNVASHTAQESRGAWTHEPPTEEGAYWVRNTFSVKEQKIDDDTPSEPWVAYLKRNENGTLMFWRHLEGFCGEAKSVTYFEYFTTSIALPPVPQTVNVEEER